MFRYAVMIEHRASGKIDNFAIESVRRIPANELDQLAYDGTTKFPELRQGGRRREDFRIEVTSQRGTI